MWRSVASNALTLLIVALVAAAGVLAWGQREYSGPGPLTEAICFRVERNASFAAVSRALEAQGAISDARILRIGADYADKTGSLRFGSYLIEPSASMAEIVDRLTRGGQSTCGSEINFRIGVTVAETVLRELDPTTQRFVEVAKFDPATDAPPEDYARALQDPGLRFRVTVAEGTTVWHVIESLKRADFLEGPLDTLPPEGSLATESYEVTRGASRAALIAEMQARQTRILDALWEERVDGLPYQTKEEALIMASIVEKETGIADERRQVASVFVNRMRQGMRLQTDPTVIYGVTEGKAPLGRGLRRSELDRPTPWNTYTNDGLPPTPIANPGRASIAATLDPDRTEYLFFVADGTGGHAFARTLAEHNANVAVWRRIEAERATQGQAN